ncbi:MAG: hypothetical protein M3530_11055, partial [Thermoproteota archaeon]|nr:hypothetical protein [Thermoproteota archaeon]
VEAMISGRIILSRQALTNIQSTLEQIRDGLDKDCVIFEPSLVEKLKGILSTAKSDEKDYLFVKKIRVLLIDDDEFAQFNISRNIGNSIQLDTCSSVTAASDKLKGGHYDAILCNFEPSDAHVIELFKQYSHKMPIVAMSVSEDPKLVQLAGKTGALDYIIKNDSGLKWVSRSLHKVTSEWNQKTRISENQKLLMAPPVRKILKEMMATTRVTQRIQSKIEYDSKIINSMKEHERSLQSLINEGYVVKEPTQLKLACPNCKSINLVTNYLCQNCNSSNFTRGNVLEHNKCGHSDLETNFQEDNRLVCPKCRKELKLIGVDYFRIVSALKCKECRNIFTIPEITYDCNDCGNSGFSLSDGSWKQIYNYEISAEKLEEIKQNIISLSPIEGFLQQKGFEIKLDETIVSDSQSYGPFDLIAERGSELILVSVIGSEIENAVAKLIELDNVSKFIHRKVSKYAILFAEPTEVARNLIDKFDILPILIEHEREMANRFKEFFRG